MVQLNECTESEKVINVNLADLVLQQVSRKDGYKLPIYFFGRQKHGSCYTGNITASLCVCVKQQIID